MKSFRGIFSFGNMLSLRGIFSFGNILSLRGIFSFGNILSLRGIFSFGNILSLRGILSFGIALMLMGCAKGDDPPMQYMPHMANTPVLKAQKGYAPGKGKGSSMLMPPEGTIPRGHKPYLIKTDAEAGRKLKNPVAFNMESVMRGKERFNIYCAVCHDKKGYGKGTIVPPYPIPKSLQSDRAQEFPDGHLFHVITKGQGVMPSYASQVPVLDRWKIIHYLRALQRSENPTDLDIQRMKQSGIK